MPFISAFLSPVHLREILLSLLQRRWCFPRGRAEEAQGLGTRPSAPLCSGREPEESASLHGTQLGTESLGGWRRRGICI